LFKEVLAAVKEGRQNCLAEAIKIRQTGMLDDNLEPEDLDADYSSDDAVAVDDADML
jgi:5,10-methenyltetrahydromethanopterin hydrogenase